MRRAISTELGGWVAALTQPFVFLWFVLQVVVSAVLGFILGVCVVSVGGDQWLGILLGVLFGVSLLSAALVKIRLQLGFPW